MSIYCGLGPLCLLVVAQGCARPSDNPKSKVALPSPAVAKSDVTAKRSNVNHFEWNLKVAKPLLQETETKISDTVGDVALGFDRWTCNYTIEKGNDSNTPQEYGYLSCKVSSTGQAVETMVLCREDENRPSDCGTGVLRVSDDAGQLHQLELACRSASSDCGQRPTVTENLVPGATAGATGSAAPTGGARTKPASGPLGHFQWRVETGDDKAASAAKQLSNRRGDIEMELKGWQCSYSISQQKADPNYPELELGYTTCKSKSSTDTVETVLLCAENQARPSACNMGSLRLADDGGGVHSITMSCRNPNNPCW